MSKKESPESLAIITINYNGYEVTKAFIASLSHQSDPDFHVFIIDTSTDREEHTWPQWVTIYSAPNDGYSFAVNSGVREASLQGYTQFVEINNDTTVAKDFVKSVKTALAVHPYGLVGAKIYYYPGYEFHKVSQEEQGKILWYAGGAIDWNTISASHTGVNELDTGGYDQETQTDFITGCCIGFTLTTFNRIGPWDEDYFLYWEDADWCVRARLLGLKLWYCPTIVVWHKNAQSTGGSGSALHVRYQERNRLRFGLRFAPWRTRVHLIKNEVLRLIRRKA